MNELFRRLLFLPEQASTFAQRVDRLHYFVIATTMVMSTLVGVAALLLFVRYRRRSETQTTLYVVTSRRTEAIFVTVPLLFFLAWFAIGYRDFVGLSTPPRDAIDVYVMAKQWMWKFSYPDGPSAVETLHLPANRPVRLLLTSRDVIHSFYVPQFRIKQDALPGRYSSVWFEPTKPGRYEILCTEYCGLSHSRMRGEVVVLEPAAYDAWLDRHRPERPERQDAVAALPAAMEMAEQGRRLSLGLGCSRCHSADGTVQIGPTWAGLYRRPTPLADGGRVVADEAYLSESIVDPGAKVVAGFAPLMPSYRGRVGASEVAALLEYIKSLREAP